jgi:isopentenyl diphosphate isomerase/L-lactate dehydrogenase-like FMN-dependent dehydrogenase
MTMFRRSVGDVLNIEEMRTRAQWLPRAVFDAIDGGASDEITLRANRTAFEKLWLRPRALADVSKRDLSTTALGTKISMPLMLAPCGFGRMANSQAELAVARAAGQAGTVFAISGSASYSPEDIAKVATGPLWYQMYLPGDRESTQALLDRVERAGYGVLCVTIDTPVTPKRERDYRNKLVMPLQFSPSLLMTGMSNPAWAKDFLMGRVGDRGAAGHIFGGVRTAYWNFAKTVRNVRPVTFADVRWLREHWKGKLVIKGVMRGDECPEMVEVGVDGIVVSNHGGRNLDCVRATIDILPEVLSAVGGRVEVFVDGGIRRGTDVVKAIALGAQACLIGRPYLFGLAAGGEAGVARVIEIFRNEIEHTMAMAGCATVGDIDSSLVTHPVAAAGGTSPAAREAIPALS